MAADLYVDDEEKSRLRLKQRQTLISRHMPLGFGDALPIKQVMVGPCRHPGVSRASVWLYLNSHGYKCNHENEHDPAKVTIQVSSAPFQTQ